MCDWVPSLFTRNCHNTVNWLCCCCVWLFETQRTAACQASLSLTISQSLAKSMSIASVMPSSHLILWHPLLLLHSILSSIRDFSNESAVCIRWPKYWIIGYTPIQKKKKICFKRSTNFRIIGKGICVCWILFIFHRTENVLVISWFSEFSIYNTVHFPLLK